MQTTDEIFKAIQADPQNKSFTDQKIQPLYHIDPKAEILIISQAPSRKAQQSMVFWNDPSGIDYVHGWGSVKLIFIILVEVLTVTCHHVRDLQKNGTNPY